MFEGTKKFSKEHPVVTAVTLFASGLFGVMIGNLVEKKNERICRNKAKCDDIIKIKIAPMG